VHKNFIRLHRWRGKIFDGETVIIFEDKRFTRERLQMARVRFNVANDSSLSRIYGMKF